MIEDKKDRFMALTKEIFAIDFPCSGYVGRKRTCHYEDFVFPRALIACCKELRMLCCSEILLAKKIELNKGGGAK